jgi:hypothetical protein
MLRRAAYSLDNLLDSAFGRDRPWLPPDVIDNYERSGDFSIVLSALDPEQATTLYNSMDRDIKPSFGPQDKERLFGPSPIGN